MFTVRVQCAESSVTAHQSVNEVSRIIRRGGPKLFCAETSGTRQKSTRFYRLSSTRLVLPVVSLRSSRLRFFWRITKAVWGMMAQLIIRTTILATIKNAALHSGRTHYSIKQLCQVDNQVLIVTTK